VWYIPPLIRFTLVYLLGVIVGINLPALNILGLTCLLTFSIFLSIFPLKVIKSRKVFLHLTLFLVSILYTQNYFSLRPSNLEEHLSQGKVFLTGVIVEEPRIGKWESKVVLKAERIKREDATQEVAGKVLARIRFPKKDLFYGERYQVKGILYFPKSSSGKGEFDYSQYLKRRGIQAVIDIRDRKEISYQGKAKLNFLKANPLVYFALKTKEKLNQNIETHLHPPYSSMLKGMMLSKGAIPYQIRDMFTKIGVAHILAISGLHVGIIAGLILLILRLLKVPKRTAFLLTILLIIFYAFITGLRAPVVRTTLMLSIFLFGYCIRRESNVYIALSLAALVLLVYNPYNLLGVGFQLSFLVILAVITLTPILEKSLPLRPIWPVRIFYVSLVAQVGALPLIAYYFHYISGIGVLANLMVIPLVTAILALGLPLAVISGVLPEWGIITAPLSELLLHGLLRLSEFLSSWEFFYLTFSHFRLPVWWILVYYSALASWPIYYYGKKKKVASNEQES